MKSRKVITSKFLWEIGSEIPFLIGIAHFIGTLFSKLLHLKNKQLIAKMKVTPIEVAPEALLWNAWIGFNATFGICLIFWDL